MLTMGKDKTFIHCDFLDEARALTPGRLVSVRDKDGFGYHALGSARQQDNGWIVPLAIVSDAEAQGVGTIRDFVVQEDGKLD